MSKVISMMLAVADAPRAAAWYKGALGATELWNLGSVVGLAIDGAPFFVGEPASNGWESPAKLGTTSLRVEVFCDDPDAFILRAIEAGATGDVEHTRDHQMPWGTHRQGGFVDPFGHIWFVGDRSPLGQRSTTVDSAEGQIRAAIAAFGDAYRAKDIEGIAVTYSETLIKDRAGAGPEGKATATPRIQQVFREFDTGIEVEVAEIVVSGDLAYARGSFAVTLTPRDGRAATVIRRRYLEIWRCESGTWRVTRTMDNEPADARDH